jgi:hypothetical protein
MNYTPSQMCTEVHYRFRQCGHTRFLRWDYCSAITPCDQLPELRRACQRYKFKFKDNQESINCFECIRVRMTVKAVHEDKVEHAQKKRKGNRGRIGRWVKRTLCKI